MTSKTLRNLIDEMACEIERLLAGSLPKDPFLLGVLNAIAECKNGGDAAALYRADYFRGLGLAAVRYLDTFDATPEAGRFIELASALSQAVEGHDPHQTPSHRG